MDLSSFSPPIIMPGTYSTAIAQGSPGGLPVPSADMVGAWPGCQFEIAMDGSLGLFGLTIAGLSLGSTLSLLLNGRRRIIFDGTDYQSY